ncbi:MAG TPA: hypothetical protein VD978_25265 [Azospirillum sp.]|nr:hypothetical protein [Azospirillum sp.]
MTTTGFGAAVTEFTRGFLIVGFTGFAGTGGRSAARILARDKQPEFPAYNPDFFTEDCRTNKLAHEKLKRIYENIGWRPFTIIETNRVIFAIALAESLAGTRQSDTIIDDIAAKHGDNLCHLKYLLPDNKPDHTEEAIMLGAFEASKAAYADFKIAAKKKTIPILQEFAYNIRLHGKTWQGTTRSQTYSHLFIIPEAVRRLVKAYDRVRHSKRIAIDSFRNPYEVEYFRRRYNEFYLVGLTRDEDGILKDLKANSRDEVADIWKWEHPELSGRSREDIYKWAAGANVEECIQKADLFINNTGSEEKIIFYLAKLLSLWQRPGCVQPSFDERGMQVALSAKLMSGCISRQVGAALAHSSGYIMGIGWNDPPQGQTPCALRTGHDLVAVPQTGDEHHQFSTYEKSMEFAEFIRSNCNDYHPYCFKDKYAESTGKEKKLELSRALHAEENAFLQAAKIGGVSAIDSTLFTTSSTCHLCAKKAYQLSVKRIVFIERYPGKTEEQVIRAGDSQDIAFQNFEGIAGTAYFKLYSPMMAEKDMIDLFLRCDD